MSTQKGPNIAASVKARLMNLSREKQVPFNEMLQLYVMERFLYRLSQSEYAGSFVLKGGLLFAVWENVERRTTLDIDLLGFTENSLERLKEVAKSLCTIEVVEDGLQYDAESIRVLRIKEDADYEGVRIKLFATLERSRVPVQIDVGFDDALVPGAEQRTLPGLLDFPSPELRCYHPLTTLAEKFQAMIKLGALNSRMKDFYDVWCLINASEFRQEEVIAACVATFDHRDTKLSMDVEFFHADFGQREDLARLWKAYCRKQRLTDQAPATFADVISVLQAFFKPIVTASHDFQR